MELELQQSKSLEENLDKVSLLEEEVTSILQHRSTRKKDISSSYSSLIPKTREKTSVPHEFIIQEQYTNKSDTVFLFDITINE